MFHGFVVVLISFSYLIFISMPTHNCELLKASSLFENDIASIKGSQGEERQQEDKSNPKINLASVYNVCADIPQEIS